MAVERKRTYRLYREQSGELLYEFTGFSWDENETEVLKRDLPACLRRKDLEASGLRWTLEYTD